MNCQLSSLDERRLTAARDLAAHARGRLDVRRRPRNGRARPAGRGGRVSPGSARVVSTSRIIAIALGMRDSSEALARERPQLSVTSHSAV